MTWEDVKRARERKDELYSEYKRAKALFSSAEQHVSKVEKDYLHRLGVEVRYRSRHDPFDDVYDVYVDGEKRGVYTSTQEVLKAVREAELAGYL
jgi:hypothetical protein